ncbi:MAG: hypothetical protein MR773_01875 [Eubacterium coprostanoligenes]|nr:hypothetical protein [Eubacterium coprostanoligenes]
MKNDSWMFPVESPMDSMFDHNKDGKLTGMETMQRDAMLYNIYEQATKQDEYNSSNYDSSKYTASNSSAREKAQKGYNILLVLAILFIALVSPVVTIGGLILDAGYFFKEPEFIFAALVTLVELIILIICLVNKRRRK